MIYNCWYCGNRINSRFYKDKYGDIHKTGVKDEDVGKHKLHDGKAFCNECCIDNYKNLSQLKKNIRAPPSDYWENGIWGEWKKERRLRNKIKPQQAVEN